MLHICSTVPTAWTKHDQKIYLRYVSTQNMTTFFQLLSQKFFLLTACASDSSKWKSTVPLLGGIAGTLGILGTVRTGRQLEDTLSVFPAKKKKKKRKRLAETVAHH